MVAIYCIMDLMDIDALVAQYTRLKLQSVKEVWHQNLDVFQIIVYEWLSAYYQLLQTRRKPTCRQYMQLIDDFRQQYFNKFLFEHDTLVTSEECCRFVKLLGGFKHVKPSTSEINAFVGETLTFKYVLDMPGGNCRGVPFVFGTCESCTWFRDEVADRVQEDKCCSQSHAFPMFVNGRWTGHTNCAANTLTCEHLCGEQVKPFLLWINPICHNYLDKIADSTLGSFREGIVDFFSNVDAGQPAEQTTSFILQKRLAKDQEQVEQLIADKQKLERALATSENKAVQLGQRVADMEYMCHHKDREIENVWYEASHLHGQLESAKQQLWEYYNHIQTLKSSDVY